MRSDADGEGNGSAQAGRSNRKGELNGLPYRSDCLNRVRLRLGASRQFAFQGILDARSVLDGARLELLASVGSKWREGRQHQGARNAVMRGGIVRRHIRRLALRGSVTRILHIAANIGIGNHAVRGIAAEESSGSASAPTAAHTTTARARAWSSLRCPLPGANHTAGLTARSTSTAALLPTTHTESSALTSRPRSTLSNSERAILSAAAACLVSTSAPTDPKRSISPGAAAARRAGLTALTTSTTALLPTTNTERSASTAALLPTTYTERSTPTTALLPTAYTERASPATRLRSTLSNSERAVLSAAAACQVTTTTPTDPKRSISPGDAAPWGAGLTGPLPYTQGAVLSASRIALPLTGAMSSSPWFGGTSRLVLISLANAKRSAAALSLSARLPAAALTRSSRAGLTSAPTAALRGRTLAAAGIRFTGRLPRAQNRTGMPVIRLPGAGDSAVVSTVSGRLTGCVASASAPRSRCS